MDVTNINNNNSIIASSEIGIKGGHSNTSKGNKVHDLSLFDNSVD